jgi:hypothetical protein
MGTGAYASQPSVNPDRIVRCSSRGLHPVIEDVPEFLDLEPGTEVEVRTRFTGEWAVGFGVVAVVGGGVKVRRHRDGAVLPLVFGVDDVRALPRQ